MYISEVTTCFNDLGDVVLRNQSKSQFVTENIVHKAECHDYKQSEYIRIVLRSFEGTVWPIVMIIWKLQKKY